MTVIRRDIIAPQAEEYEFLLATLNATELPNKSKLLKKPLS